MKRTIVTVDSSSIGHKRLNVPYSHVSPNQLLDIYLPECTDQPAPVIVFVHGGGFFGGRKDYGPLASILSCVSHGYAVVSVEYRLSMEAKWPACVHDVKCALRYITARASELGLDPDRIVLWGSSAGAAITTAVAATLTNGRVEDLTLGLPEIQPRVAAMVGWFPLTDWVSAAYQHNIPIEKTMLVASPSAADAKEYVAQGWRRVEDAALGFAIEDDLPRAFDVSPIRMVQDEFVPTLIQHGTADVVVPFADTVRLAHLVNTRIGAGLVTVQPMIGEVHGAPCFGAPGNIRTLLRWIDDQLGRDHPITELPLFGTRSTLIDDGVNVPPDDLSTLPGLTAVPTRTVEPVRNHLQFWERQHIQAQAPQGV